MSERNVSNAVDFRSTLLPMTAVACVTYAACALLLLHVLRPDYTPVNHMISDYAVGRYGWIMTTVFLALSAGCLAMLLGLYRFGPTSIVARVGTLLLGVAAIGLVVTAMYPTDLEGAKATRSGNIHDISFFVNIGSIFLATAFLAAGFGGDARWRSYQRTAIVLTLLVVVAFVLQFFTLRRGMPYGIANRFFIMVILAWFFRTSIRLRVVARE